MADMEKHRAWSSQTKKVKRNSAVCLFLTKLIPKNRSFRFIFFVKSKVNPEKICVRQNVFHKFHKFKERKSRGN